MFAVALPGIETTLTFAVSDIEKLVTLEKTLTKHLQRYLTLENVRIQELERLSNLIEITASDSWKNQEHIQQPVTQFLLAKRLLQTWQETYNTTTLNHKQCKPCKYNFLIGKLIKNILIRLLYPFYLILLY